MKGRMFLLSLAAVAVVAACTNSPAKQERKEMNAQARQEKQMLREAERDHSPDFQQVELVGNSVVYTHIFDGIIDVKTYTYDGDVCVEAERVYVFPDQMSALRHYRRAVEQAQLYDNIELFNNEVRYDLKAAQHELETKGLTKEQLKARFDKQMSDAQADLDRIKKDMKKDCKDCGKSHKKHH